MTKDLDIIDRQLELGDVKVISRDGGRIVKFIELLFSPTTKAQFAPSHSNTSIRLSVKDVDLTLPQLECDMSKSTLRDLIIGLKSIYNQIDDDSQERRTLNENL